MRSRGRRPRHSYRFDETRRERRAEREQQQKAERCALLVNDVPGSDQIMRTVTHSRWPLKQIGVQLGVSSSLVVEFKRRLMHRPDVSGRQYEEARTSRLRAAEAVLPGLAELQLDPSLYDIELVPCEQLTAARPDRSGSSRQRSPQPA